MSRFLIDTSCIIAVLCAWHEHHDRATRSVEQRLNEGGTLVIAAATLIEAYAVLTRLPPPHRLSPSDSGALLMANFMNGALEVVALGADQYQHHQHIGVNVNWHQEPRKSFPGSMLSL